MEKVNTLEELLSRDMSKYRLNVIHESQGLISVDYYDKEDDGSCLVKNIELTLIYEVPYETDMDKEQVGKIVTLLETIIDLLNGLKIQSKLTEFKKKNTIISFLNDEEG